MREGTNGTPGRPGEKHGKNKEDDKSEPPKLALPLFELLETGSDGGTLVSLLRGAAGVMGGALVVFEHESGRDPRARSHPPVRAIPPIVRIPTGFQQSKRPQEVPEGHLYELRTNDHGAPAEPERRLIWVFCPA